MDHIIKRLEPLRGLPGWQEKGEPYFDGLLDWIDRQNLSLDEIEATVDGMLAAQTRTLNGYFNYAAVFRKHFRKGYHTGEQKQNGYKPRKGY